MELYRCLHAISLERNSMNCSDCGVYMFRYHPVFGVKTRRFAECTLTNPRAYLACLQRQSYRFRQLTEVHLDHSTRYLLERLRGKFHLGDDTFALGVYLYYVLFMRTASSPEQERMFGTACLYTACKAREGSNHINLQRFRKHSHNAFNPEEFCEIEGQILTELNFDLQLPTFLDFLYFYFSNGSTFSSQQLLHPAKVEDRAIVLSRWFLSTGVFMLVPQEQLACYILHRSRRQSHASEVWNWYMEEYTGHSTKEVSAFVRDIDGLIASFGAEAQLPPQ